MIKINDKPVKKTEYFRGICTMKFKNITNDTWEFFVLRTSNGITTFDVEIDRGQFHKDEKQDESMVELYVQLMQETIKTNLAKEQVDWKPIEKT